MTTPDSSRQPSSWREGFIPDKTGTYEKVEIPEEQQKAGQHCDKSQVEATCKMEIEKTKEAVMEVVEEPHLPEFTHGDFYFNLKKSLRNHSAIANPDPYDGPIKAYVPTHGVKELTIGHNGDIRLVDEEIVNGKAVKRLIEPDEDTDMIFFSENTLELLEWDPDVIPKRDFNLENPRVSGVDLRPDDMIRQAIESESELGATKFNKNNPCSEPTRNVQDQDPTNPLPWMVTSKKSS